MATTKIDTKKMQYLSRINDQLCQFQGFCQREIFRVDGLQRRYRLSVGPIPEDAVVDDDLTCLDRSFMLMGAYGPIYKGLRCKELTFNFTEGDDYCRETQILAHKMMNMVGHLTGMWSDGPLWDIARAALPIEEKRDYILRYIENFTETVRTCGSLEKINLPRKQAKMIW